MKRHLTLKNILAVLVVLLLVAQACTWIQLHKTNQDVQDLKGDKQMVLNELDSAAQQSSLTPIPGKKLLYLADLNITVPLSAAASTVRYTNSTPDTGDNSTEVRLTSSLMTDHATHVKSCADMVRLKIEDKPNAYSPDQPLFTTVKLADGRTLQVYASTTKECAAAWLAMSPQSLALPFKDAQSY